MSLKKVRASWKRHRALVGRDIDIHAEWPTMFGLIRAGRPRWFVFLYLFFTVHSFPAVALFRAQSFFFEAGCPPLATFVSRLNSFLFGVTIGNQVRSNGSILFAHGHVVLDGWTVLGDHVVIYAPDDGGEDDRRDPVWEEHRNLEWEQPVLQAQVATDAEDQDNRADSEVLGVE